METVRVVWSWGANEGLQRSCLHTLVFRTQRIHGVKLTVSDLRQDMLTLQVIRIMDTIWQSEGMDLRYSVRFFSDKMCILF